MLKINSLKEIFYVYFFIIVFSILTFENYFAQSEINFTTKEVVISSSLYAENFDSVNQSISILSKNTINFNNPTNLASALIGTSGIFMQQSNHGAGSPFVRGLTGNQTLILVDGIRLNNSTFRYGPNQYLNTINLAEIERVEILRGSGSVQFGSDAIGGAVHIITKSPKIGLKNNLSSEIQLKCLSDNMEKSANAFIEYSSVNSGYSANFSVKNYGDVIAGKGIGKESPSSYNEYSFNLKNTHLINEKILLTYNYQYLQQNDVDRFDQVDERGYEYYKFDPQIRQLAYIKNEIFSENDFYKNISLTFSCQKSSEVRKIKKLNELKSTYEKDVIDTWGVNLLVLSQPIRNMKINSGIEYYYDFVNSFAKVNNLENNTVATKRGLYSDKSKFHNFSIFSLANYELNQFEFGVGGRFNLAKLDINDEEFGKPKINPNAITGYFSVAYKLNKILKIISKVNSAYRIPNINDVSTFGLFDFGIEVPNNKLAPEKSTNYEIGLKLLHPKIYSSIFLFRNNLTDLIERIKSTYNESEFNNGENVYTKVNYGEAYIQGFEFDMQFILLENLFLTNNLTYTYGQNTTLNEPMRRIPPIYGAFIISYHLSNNIELKVDYLFAGKQKRLSSGDLDDHRIDKSGTPNWNILNFYSQYSYAFLNIGIGVNNIFNEAYRTHGSGIDGIGRSYQIICKVLINKSTN
ncbi:MAG: TonB-dependent receptor [Ignavibacteriae bacterium]|nr:TonB-dependent receptor [Ignavibacteriota bacterium]